MISLDLSSLRLAIQLCHKLTYCLLEKNKQEAQGRWDTLSSYSHKVPHNYCKGSKRSWTQRTNLIVLLTWTHNTNNLLVLDLGVEISDWASQRSLVYLPRQGSPPDIPQSWLQHENLTFQIKLSYFDTGALQCVSLGHHPHVDATCNRDSTIS